MHFREIKPRDFYFAQTLRDAKKSYIPLLIRLSLQEESFLQLRANNFRAVVKWVIDTLLVEKILTAENWMEISFHLNKQRWDSGVDWLESQPMSKIEFMISVNQKVAEEQENSLKK